MPVPSGYHALASKTRGISSGTEIKNENIGCQILEFEDDGEAGASYPGGAVQSTLHKVNTGIILE